jgi:hypothetical protein
VEVAIAGHFVLREQGIGIAVPPNPQNLNTFLAENLVLARVLIGPGHSDFYEWSNI